MKKAVMIALAFVGAVVGAGFASGQEMLQYYLAHGPWGFAAVAIAAVAMVAVSYTTFQLSSYEQASAHSIVFDAITHPILSKIVDIFIIITLFSVGFVMLAGAGANLYQQFGLPTWIGSLIMAVLVAVLGLLDVDKLTAVIGGITPFIIITIVIAAVYSALHPAGTMDELFATAAQIEPAVGNWALSAVNYVALAFAMAVSIMVVMGGAITDPKSAGRGGFLGGLLFGLLLLIAAGALFLQLPVVVNAPMPMLALVTSIHPAFGLVMAFVIYGMIFNTAISLYYAIAKRVEAVKPAWFKPTLFGTVAIGFALSFLDFQALVNKLYPAIGYMGIVMTILIIWGWWKARHQIKIETERRNRIRRLLNRRWRSNKRYTERHHRKLIEYVKRSNVEDVALLRAIGQETVTDIAEDPDANLDPVLAERYQLDEEQPEIPEFEDGSIENFEHPSAYVDENDEMIEPEEKR